MNLLHEIDDPVLLSRRRTYTHREEIVLEYPLLATANAFIKRSYPATA